MKTDILVAAVTEAVVRHLEANSRCAALQQDGIPVGVSNRHVHLAQEELHRLFGTGFALTKLKELSQPGQYACEETVLLAGPGGVIEKVRILGPVRKQTQVEISAADGFRLGIRPPIRDSGDLDGSAGITLVGPAGSVTLQNGVIIAARHIHMHPTDADRFGVQDKARVCLKAAGPRGLIFQEVLVRVHPEYRLEAHVDIDEANAAGLNNQDLVTIQK